VQATVGIEDVRKPDQVPLVGSAAVVEDQQTGGFTARGALFVREGAHRIFTLLAEVRYRTLRLCANPPLQTAMPRPDGGLVGTYYRPGRFCAMGFKAS
jgi:hypothetical protein